LNYSDKQIEALIAGIYDGSITERELPTDLYFAIAEYLKKGLYEGFGGTEINFAGDTLTLLEDLRENIYLFSGAKTFQTVKAMDAMLTDDEGLRSFKDFKVFARQEYDLYNETWAKTEYETAIGQAQNAHNWSNIEADKEALPLLRYSAVMDANTSEICAPLNGTVLPVDDPFWDVFSPENHYGCRCLLEQLSEGTVTVAKEVKERATLVGGEMNDAFKFNPGKERVIFSEEHPYFDVPAKDKGFASRNFDLPIPSEDGE